MCAPQIAYVLCNSWFEQPNAGHNGEVVANHSMQANWPQKTEPAKSPAPNLSEAQWVLFSETVLPKQYSARSLCMGGIAR